MNKKLTLEEAKKLVEKLGGEIDTSTDFENEKADVEFILEKISLEKSDVK